DSTTSNVTVRPSVDQKMYINNTTQCLQGNNFSFIDSSTIASGSINQHDWDFGDGQISTNTVSPTHTYKNAGTYTITLINSSALGCSDTIKRTVNVLNKLNATITPSNAQSFCQGSSVTLKTNASSNYTYQWVKDGSAIGGANTDSLVVNASGNYHIIIDVPGGCGDTSSDVSVTVKPKVTISAINGPTNPGFNTTKSYTVAKQAGVTFNWIVTNGTILNGQGTDSINVQWGNPATASIKVYAECADTVTLNLTIVGGIQTAKNSIRAEIYPNPTNDILNIDASQFKSNYMIRLVDLSGKTLYTHQQSAAGSTLDMSGLPAGSYIIELSSNDDIYRQMIIKK
ncbi:MAG: T9SS type A sorting domain-containing protein, partial [Bacteroidetes bacterium]|nr:T9SS type A sorting domain-containing protein [Bacteroidota bacterium]